MPQLLNGACSSLIIKVNGATKYLANIGIVFKLHHGDPISSQFRQNVHQRENKQLYSGGACKGYVKQLHVDHIPLLLFSFVSSCILSDLLNIVSKLASMSMDTLKTYVIIFYPSTQWNIYCYFHCIHGCDKQMCYDSHFTQGCNDTIRYSFHHIHWCNEQVLYDFQCIHGHDHEISHLMITKFIGLAKYLEPPLVAGHLQVAKIQKHLGA